VLRAKTANASQRIEADGFSARLRLVRQLRHQDSRLRQSSARVAGPPRSATRTGEGNTTVLVQARLARVGGTAPAALFSAGCALVFGLIYRPVSDDGSAALAPFVSRGTGSLQTRRWSKGDSNSPSHPERQRSEGRPHGSRAPLPVSESRPPEKRHRSAGSRHGTGRADAFFLWGSNAHMPIAPDGRGQHGGGVSTPRNCGGVGPRFACDRIFLQDFGEKRAWTRA
jgi:hypothetical protein